MESLPAPSAECGSMEGDVADSSPPPSLLPPPPDGAELLLLALADSSPPGQWLHAAAECATCSLVLTQRTHTSVFVMRVDMCL